MANSTKVRSGLPALMQDHLSANLVSNLVNIMPMIAILLAKDGNKVGTSFGLGRPKSGQIYSGIPMSKPRKEEILGSDTYMPIIDTILPNVNDGKVLGQRDTMPDVADPQTNHTTAGLIRPFHRWVERAEPVLVWKKDIRRTKNRNGGGGQKANAAVGDLWRYAVDKSMQTHLKWWNSKLWGAKSVAPSNVNADVWDNPYSFRAHLATDNTYAGVDRALSTYYRGNYDETHRAADLVSLVHQANYGSSQCAKVGQGIGLIVCGLDLFPQFITQVDALKGQVIYDGKLPGIGETGFTREILRYRNTFVIMDPECPSKSRGDSTNAMLGINLDTWTVAVSPDANFEADEPFDLSKGRAGLDAIKSQIRTELIIACENPAVNQWWEDVG